MKRVRLRKISDLQNLDSLEIQIYKEVEELREERNRLTRLDFPKFRSNGKNERKEDEKNIGITNNFQHFDGRRVSSVPTFSLPPSPPPLRRPSSSERDRKRERQTFETRSIQLNPVESITHARNRENA